MRCPKCHYISFDNGDRCRNCGYEFALAADITSLDLPIQTGEEAIGPLSDFQLADLDEPPAPPAPAPAPRPMTSSLDLPLFRDRNDDAPLVTPAAVPRPPLAVRRSNPGVPRTPARIHFEEPELDLDAPPAPLPAPAEAQVPDDESPLQPAAPAGPRLVAAMVDAAILGAIGSIVVYLTLKVCGVTLAQVFTIPLAPLVSFLFLIAGGYFTLFVAANGQTIGKMAAGLKVVPAEGAAPRVPLGHAVLRAAAYLVSALPAGLGFVPALLGDERRAIHDRLAATRVVKA